MKYEDIFHAQTSREINTNVAEVRRRRLEVDNTDSDLDRRPGKIHLADQFRDLYISIEGQRVYEKQLEHRGRKPQKLVELVPSSGESAPVVHEIIKLGGDTEGTELRVNQEDTSSSAPMRETDSFVTFARLNQRFT